MNVIRCEPGPDQESVWDYPRPPRLEESSKHVQVVFAGELIAETRRALRVLETSHPPVYYISPEDVRLERLAPSARRSFCEFKGVASYWTLTAHDNSSADAAWSYEAPEPAFSELKGYLAFYPGRAEACYLDGELVTAQPGGFYGGWITSAIVGPFKGAPETTGW